MRDHLHLTPCIALHLFLAFCLGLAIHPLAAEESNSSVTPAAIPIGEFEFKISSPWSVKESTRPMVKALATWTDPDESGHPPLDAAFYHFGEGQGGSTRANIDRWKGQFRGQVDEEIEELELGGRKVMLVFLAGTYLDGPMFGKKTPKEGHALLGAILESDKGAVFIKATAPATTAEACRESFRVLASSPFKE